MSPTMGIFRVLSLAALAAFGVACSDAGATGTAEPLVVGVDRPALTLEPGATTKITLRADGQALPAGALVAFSSSNPSVATVDNTGIVTAVGPGLAMVRSDVSVKGKSGKTEVEVTVKVASARIAVEAGSGQTGRVGAALPAPVAVRVTDNKGNIVSGMTVNFAARTRDGNVYMQNSAKTDASGVAALQWTLGTLAGTQTLTATAASNNAPTVQISAEALPGELVSIRAMGGEHFAGVAGAPLGSPLQVQVTDQFSNPVAGATVTWQVVTGAGSVDNTTTTTDANGITTAVWTLGSIMGEQTVSATSGTSAVLFTAQASAPSAARVVITEGDGSTLTWLGANAALAATAYTSNNEPMTGAQFTWTSLTPAIATVSNTGVVTAVSNGAVKIVASVNGRADTALVTVQQEVASITVNPTSVELAGPGASTLLSATAKDAGGAAVYGADLQWDVTQTAVATVDANGRVTAKAPGKSKAQASAGFVSGSAEINVGTNSAISSVVVLPAYVTLNVGQTATLQAEARDAQGQVVPGAAVSWTSSAPAVATVSASGVVTPVAGGTATITATAGGKSGTSYITVSAQQQPAQATSLKITPAVDTLDAVGQQVTLTAVARTATGTPVQGTVSFTSLDPAVATVSAEGVVTAKAVGTSRIVAMFNGLADTARIVVRQKVTRVALTPAALSLAIGTAAPLTLTAYDANGTVVPGVTAVWTSSDTSVARVSTSGDVLARKAGSAQITAAAGTHTAVAALTVNPAGNSTVARVVITPDSDTIRAIGWTKKFTAVALDAQGNTVAGTPITWTSLNPAVVTVDGDGTVLSKSIGLAMVVAAAVGCTGCDADTAMAVVRQEPAKIELNTTSMKLEVGEVAQIQAVVKDGAGTAIPGIKPMWTATPAGVVQVSNLGQIAAVGSGTAVVTAQLEGAVAEATITVEADQVPPQEEQATAPPVAANGEFVVFPSEAVAFLIGPQLKAGSSANPWSWFDENARKRGLELGADASTVDTYYDFALTQYALYYRTGDVRFLEAARASADAVYAKNSASGTSVAPRSAALGGVMLRALDGKPEYWPWIRTHVNHHLWNWVERRLDKVELHYGVRDGSYALLYGAMLAAADPDQAIRAEYRTRVHDAAVNYYVPRQHADGLWYWYDSAVEFNFTLANGTQARHSQPFMVGLLLDAMVAVHRLTGDARVGNSITKAVERLHSLYRENDVVDQRPQYRWRGHWYFVWEPGTPLVKAPTGPSDPRYAADGVTVVQGTAALRGGSDLNSIREVRQLNTLLVHAYGYAYLISGDARFLSWGDEVFAASYGNTSGPANDGLRSLADYRAKEYNQAYRTAGRYLAWRAGAR